MNLNNNYNTTMNDDFSIGLFEVGDVTSCVYSWCCARCALAESVVLYFTLKYSLFTICNVWFCSIANFCRGLL